VALEFLKGVRKAWARDIALGYPEQVVSSIEVVVEEVCRNTLHGDQSLIRRAPLGDGSTLILASDIIGNDHLVPTGASIGHEVIKAIVGEVNFIYQVNENVYETFVRIHPRVVHERLAIATCITHLRKAS
jgi:hypothetical protein